MQDYIANNVPLKRLTHALKVLLKISNIEQIEELAMTTFVENSRSNLFFEDSWEGLRSVIFCEWDVHAVTFKEFTSLTIFCIGTPVLHILIGKQCYDHAPSCDISSRR